MSPSYQADSHIALDDVHYAPFAPGERFYRLMGDVSGKRILELACGGAQNSVALARWGAEVVALDFSPKQLGYAMSLRRRSGADFELVTGDMESPTMFRPASFDVVMSSFGWEFIPDLKGCLERCTEILRPDGQLVMSTVHPLSAFDWNVAARSLNVPDYFNLPVEVWEDPVPEGHSPGLTFFRTIEELVSSVIDAGLTIEGLIEPYPIGMPDDPRSPYAGRYWADHWERLTRVPFAVVISARKVV
ncbi:MAG: class I SAM-dependent methyltransferase [Dehalococcoidia bacterium]|nr:class I SAM-dependent methyltransferase [Dehalococcoidia bacterium]